MGWTPDVRNFFQLCGFSIFGIVSGGGAGKYAAEWIVDGQPSDDLWELDVRRFGPWAANRCYYEPRALDVYGHEYAIGFPHEDARQDGPSAPTPCTTGSSSAAPSWASSPAGSARSGSPRRASSRSTP